MRLIYTTPLLFLIKCSNANKIQMERDFDILMREFIQEAQEKDAASDEKIETAYNYDFYEEERGLTEDSPFASLLSRINGYGCWCYLDGEHKKAGGPVQDGMDSFCKTMILGYRCMNLDSDEIVGDPLSNTFPLKNDDSPTGECSIDTVEYNSGIGGTADSVEIACEKRNVGNNCAINACKIENTFVKKILRDLFTGNIDTSLGHAEGFNPAVSCVNPEAPNRGRECCGTYPSRFQFGTGDGKRKCCFDKTFDAESTGLQCCPDGQILASCD